MSAYIKIFGKYSYKIDSIAGTVTITADEVENIGTTTSGGVRLELWLTSAPWDPNGPNAGYKIAVDPLGISSGALSPGNSFTNISATVPMKSQPPAGNYFVTLVAAQYTGTAPTIDDGYIINDSHSFTTLVTVGANGSIFNSSITMPSLSVATQQIYEGDSGTSDMTFTVVMSHAVPYAVTVQVDTIDETSTAGVDYQSQHKTLTFAPGATTATLAVPIIGNTRFEPTRVFEVQLSKAMGATIAPNSDVPGTNVTAWGIILDNDPAPLDAVVPTDESFRLQWYLFSTKLPYVWTHATGKGIKIAVLDQGIDAANPDLAKNVSLALGRNSLSMSAGGAPVLASDNHGTEVAGVIAAAKDGKGIVGVAYDAQLVSLYTPSVFSPDYLTEVANAFRYAAGMDVLNNSWGFGNLLKIGTNWAFLDNANDPLFKPAFDALRDLAATGRDGLGTVVVQSAGNGYNYGDDTNLHNFQNSRYIITVGATDSSGYSSIFSTTGASILVAAPGGGGYGDFESILTTDRAGTAGNNAGNYTFVDGTSFAAPIVSGIVALMLEVNPRLGYRDVQQILAYTAHQVGSSSNWVANGAHDWNGGGLQYDLAIQSTGFGLVDALAATRLAATWDSVPRTSANVVDVIASKTTNLAIPDNTSKSAISTINIDSNVIVERVDVTVNITHPFIGDLQIALVAPSGTISILLYRPSQGALSALGSSQHDVHFTFNTVLDWGESAQGSWALLVKDSATGNVGTLDSWSLDVIGHQPTADHTYIYTAQYAQLVAADPERAVLSDTSAGKHTINASALGSDDVIDLSGATPSVINGAKLTIAAGTTIVNAYGGDGNNLLIANAKGSVLHGMAGNDVLIGAAGNDTLDGGAGNDQLDGGGGINTALYHGARGLYTITQTANGFTISDTTGAEGIDQLTHIQRLQFADTALAFDIDGDGGQAFRIYQAAFNRTPDKSGLGYWIAQMDHGMSLHDVALGFVQSGEFQTLYGANPSNADIVTRFYTNVLHRAPDQAGADYWTKLLDAHSLSTADVLMQFSESAENQAALIGVVKNGIEYAPYV